MTEREQQYIRNLEQDQEFILERLREAIFESDLEKRRELYEAAIEVCVHTRGG